jgi:hypothetical protein
MIERNQTALKILRAMSLNLGAIYGAMIYRTTFEKRNYLTGKASRSNQVDKENR